MNFPALCIDNFYHNPDQIRKFALSLEYNKQPGNYPGLRTNPLHEVDYNFYNTFCSKLFSAFYNYKIENVEWNVTSYFQKIFPYSEDRNSPLNSGWYHEDSYGSIAAGVIYLNPHSNPDAGTTIGNPISNINLELCDYEWRDKLYAEELIDRVEYQHKVIDHNSKFTKTLEFKNIYNRLILYDGVYWHKESNFFASDNEPRLTQIFFINSLKCVDNTTPLQKVNSCYI